MYKRFNDSDIIHNYFEAKKRIHTSSGSVGSGSVITAYHCSSSRRGATNYNVYSAIHSYFYIDEYQDYYGVDYKGITNLQKTALEFYSASQGDRIDVLPSGSTLECPKYITLMANVNVCSSSNKQSIISKISSSNSYKDHCYELFLQPYNHQRDYSLHFKIYNEGGLSHEISSSTILQTGSWYNVAGSYDGNYTRLFINGIEENMTSSINTSFGANKNLRTSSNLELSIGGSKYNDTYFTGSLCDIKVFNRPLMESYISRSMRIEEDIDSDTYSPLVGYWKLCSGSSEGLYDIINYTGTINDYSKNCNYGGLINNNPSYINMTPRYININRIYNPPLNDIVVFSISNDYYGEKIQPKTFHLRYITDNIHIQDNGSGSLYYITGSYSSMVNFSDKSKICGDIFYDEGISVIRSSFITSSIDSGDWDVECSGSHRVFSTNYICRLKPFEFLYSTNPTIVKKVVRHSGSSGYYYTKIPDNYYTSSIDKIVPIYRYTGSDPYITTIGMYNEDLELLGVAKLAKPVRKSRDIPMEIRVSIDF